MEKRLPLLRNWRILLLIGAIVLSIVLLYTKPLTYGPDFVGGVNIEVELEHPANSTEEMNTIKTILENRLSGMGLKNIQVVTWGNQFLVVRMPNASPEEIHGIEKIIMSQARYVERVDGKLAIKGNEISIDTSSRGGIDIRKVENGWHWQVAVRHNAEGGKRFGEAIAGKMGRPIDSFIDPPENTSILFTEQTYKKLHSMTKFETIEGQDLSYHAIDNGIYIIENRSQIPVIQIRTKNETDNVTQNFDLNDLLLQLKELKEKGINTIIIAEDKGDNISMEVENFIAENGFKVIRKPREKNKEEKIYGEWIKDLTGLQSTAKLGRFPPGPVYTAVIEGYAITKSEAEKRAKEVMVLISSGNLPIKILPICGTEFAEKGGQCGGRETIFDPTLGSKFLSITAIIGFIAIIVVSTILFIRYKKPILVIPIMLTCLSEALIILGFASAINWNIDLLAVAGILIVIGTGVDNQIVIIDETLKKERKKEVVSIIERIRSAFFIIFVSAGTTIVAMIPLMNVEAGMLKGFAFTTIVGILIGVFITRPAFAEIVKYIVK